MKLKLIYIKNKLTKLLGSILNVYATELML